MPSNADPLLSSFHVLSTPLPAALDHRRDEPKPFQGLDSE